MPRPADTAAVRPSRPQHDISCRVWPNFLLVVLAARESPLLIAQLRAEGLFRRAEGTGQRGGGRKSVVSRFRPLLSALCSLNYSTSRPIERAVPSTVLMAASTLAALRSGILV